MPLVLKFIHPLYRILSVVLLVGSTVEVQERSRPRKRAGLLGPLGLGGGRRCHGGGERKRRRRGGGSHIIHRLWFPIWRYDMQRLTAQAARAEDGSRRVARETGRGKNSFYCSIAFVMVPLICGSTRCNGTARAVRIGRTAGAGTQGQQKHKHRCIAQLALLQTPD